jgi:hypothetical protein
VSTNDNKPGKNGLTRALRKPAAIDASVVIQASANARKPLKISTVSHTLEVSVAERLRNFAFRERISESAVIEYALRQFFGDSDDATLGRRLRDAGAALRRKT